DLMKCADLVFTGGRSLFELKQRLHPRTYCFPSAIDVGHFRSAPEIHTDPADQAHIPRPRIGYSGVLDERLDARLIARLAARRPEWHFVFVGPHVKIDASK